MCLTVEFCLEGYYLSLVKQAEIQDTKKRVKNMISTLVFSNTWSSSYTNYSRVKGSVSRFQQISQKLLNCTEFSFRNNN